MTKSLHVRVNRSQSVSKHEERRLARARKRRMLAFYTLADNEISPQERDDQKFRIVETMLRSHEGTW